MLSLVPPSDGQSMDFNDLAPGTLFGAAAGDSPFDVVYSQNGIDMAVDSFSLGSFSGFFDAKVGGPYATAFATPALELDNITVVFTLSSVGFPVSELTFDYVEYGGAVNIAVNGHAVLELDTITDLPQLVAPGVIGAVGSGTVMLSAPVGGISSLRVGGQELVVDNLTVIPEPVSGVLLFIGMATLAIKRRRCALDCHCH